MNKGELLQAARMAQVISATLTKRGLRPAFSDFLLTEADGLAWLFAVLDVSTLERLEAYTTPELLHQISTELRGAPVFVSNSSGLRYAVLLSRLPTLPKRADYPGHERGALRLGLSWRGEVRLPWGRLGHLLVAGQTGSGKSAFLRLLAAQALAEGAALLLGDLDGATFPMLADHPSLLAPLATTPDAMRELVERALGECDARAALYQQTGGYPDNLSEYNAIATREGAPALPPVLVILDEFNAAAVADSGLAQTAASLGWRGRKFGINLVFAAQDFTKAIVGRARDQVGAVVCFRVRSSETARAVGCAEAVRIPAGRPGLAVTDRWGLMQAYYLDKAALIQGEVTRAALTADETALVTAALERNGGRFTLTWLEGEGVAHRQARRLLDEWRARGWLERDPHAGNAHTITARLRALLPERQTCQSAPNLPKRGRVSEGERNEDLYRRQT